VGGASSLVCGNPASLSTELSLSPRRPGLHSPREAAHLPVPDLGWSRDWRSGAEKEGLVMGPR
jgi:hypothetical protein